MSRFFKKLVATPTGLIEAVKLQEREGVKEYLSFGVDQKFDNETARRHYSNPLKMAAMKLLNFS
jgi:hypothetical protein